MEEKKQKRALELVKATTNIPLAQLNASLDMNDKLDALLSKEVEMPEPVEEVSINNFPQSIKVEIPGVSVLTLKGDKGDKGDDGDNYVLTENDKKDIAGKVTVPVVEKIIERIETVIEQPVITNEIKEVAVTDTAEEIADKLNTLDAKVDKSVIKGFKELENRVQRIAETPRGGGGSSVSKVLPGNGISVSPSDGRGDVVVSATPMFVHASKYGIYADTGEDMTSRLSAALNASITEGFVLVLPKGTITISSQINVTGFSTGSIVTYAGTVNWNRPIGIKGAGNYNGAGTIIRQTNTTAGHIYYFPSNGNITSALFEDFTLENDNRDFSNIYAYGIQLGGGPIDCVLENIRVNNVTGVGLYSVFRLDDCTGFDVTGMNQNGLYKYYVETGYNADSHSFRDFRHSFDHPVSNPCTNTLGTNTLTGISTGRTPFIYVGMSVSGVGIQSNTTIVSKTTTSVTLSKVTTSAVSSFDVHLGTMISCLGATGSAYTGSGFATIANANNYFNKNRISNPNVIQFDNILFNRAEGIIEDYSSSYGVTVKNAYLERAHKIATFSGSGAKNILIDNIFLSQPETMRQDAITIATSVPQGSIKNITTDGSPNFTYVVSIPNMSSPSEFGKFEISDCIGAVLTGAGPALSAQARKLTFGCIENGTGIYQYSTASGDANFDPLGIDIFEVSLTQSGRAIIGPNSVNITQYRQLKFVFIQDATGGRTITMNTQYRKPDGTQWGILPARAANERYCLTFTHVGNGIYVSEESSLTPGGAISTKTANYTATTSDYTLLCDATSGSITISLPTVASSVGSEFYIKKIDSSVNTVTIDPNGSELIDGAATRVIATQWETLKIINNGTAWYVS